jgi:hypothetical protein
METRNKASNACVGEEIWWKYVMAESFVVALS